MRIDVSKIPLEGLVLSQDLNPDALELDTEIIKFRGPIKIKAEVYRITNAVNVRLNAHALMYVNCSRCLNEFEINFKKNIALHYALDKSDLVIDLDPDIREEIILDYPVKPLCKDSCKGLCLKCGKNLNEDKCNCLSV